MQTEMCHEKNDQTSIIVHKGALAPQNKINVSQTILLAQKPEETVDLQFSLNFSQKCDRYTGYYNYTFEYNFALTFKNNLHDMSNDYGYEIDFYQHVQNNGSSSHTLLFSEKHIRKTNKISITKTSTYTANQSYPEFFQILLINTNERHMCCRIRRYNIKAAKDVFDNQDIVQKGHVGKMLLETGLYSDVSLYVGEKLFRVHKDILSSASDIFKAMFSHDMMENQKGKVIINDYDAEIVAELLTFIYTGKASLLSKKPAELFQIAHKYEIHDLKAQCEEYFLFAVNSENVIDILHTASLYQLTDLRRDLLKFIQNHENEMVKEKSFQVFLCRDLKVDTIAYTLKLCDKYKEFLNDVEIEAFKFVKENGRNLVNNEEFLKLFESHSLMMKKMFIFINKNE